MSTLSGLFVDPGVLLPSEVALDKSVLLCVPVWSCVGEVLGKMISMGALSTDICSSVT